MKLLFDQNLSPSLINRLADLFPDSNHVFPLGLDYADDRKIREYALLLGFPPKVIWIRRGNCSTSAIEQILRNYYEEIKVLSQDSTIGILTIF